MQESMWKDYLYYRMNIEQMEKQNPFYSNHIFTKKDIDRCIWSPSLLERVRWFLFAGTFVQCSDGYAFIYKRLGDQYLLIKAEKL